MLPTLSHSLLYIQDQCKRDTRKKMGSIKQENGIPFLDFSRESRNLEQGSEGWKKLCKQVREACEGYGCFQVAYDKIHIHLHENMLIAMKDLFDLPLETKQKNSSSKPYHGYLGKSDQVPLYESLGIEDAPKLHVSQAFTDLMWPQTGNPSFCETINTVSKVMHELELIIRKMVFQSFGVEKYYESNIESSENIFRVMKYSAPPKNEGVGLVAHTDKGILTILYQDVNGLEVLSKDGDWFQVAPKQGTFIIFVGEMLKAWSNGRIHAAKHRVIMRGDKERYTYALFTSPKEGEMVEVPKELVDKDHPLLFKSFNFMDFLRYFYSNLNQENALEVYAGLSLI